tara:strand:- start:147 stop:473 length:327 start_codon:yes stop_codon:yes gene_type:complete
MIDQKKLENDLQYIAETDVEYAELTAKLSKEVHDLKHIKGKYISITNADIPVSKAQEKFFSTDEFKNYNKKLCDLETKVGVLRNKRLSAVMRIEVWRTLEASRRKGNV